MEKKLESLINKIDVNRLTDVYNSIKDKDENFDRAYEVLDILYKLNVDIETLMAALIYETINEPVTDFGEEIELIVKCLIKINKLELNDNSENSAIYLRKVLVGLAEDPRVLYIKLADRLYEMNHIDDFDVEKRIIKANDTMNVLVPIAHRLGINSVKSKLENHCLKVLKPDVYNDILERLSKTEADLNANLETMKDNISNLLLENGINHEIKGRVKSVYSIYNKLSTGRQWSDIYDILAMRVFVQTEAECYTVIGLIHSQYRPVPKRFKDFIANPKENMYQSLHTTVFGENGEMFEVQVRTYEMDEIAEKGIASHWSYKEKGTKKVQALMEQKLEMFRNIIEQGEKETEEGFEESVTSNLLSDLIYVFTPKGDVIELPKDSTPIDFAYRIHTKVGSTTTGAIVNDQIVPLSYNLQNNDIIKIITNNSATPNLDWLSFVKTTQAKNSIKSYFNKIDREEHIETGKLILEKEIRKRHLSTNDVLDEEKLNKVLNDLKMNSLEELYLSIGTLRFTAGYIINLTTEDKHSVDDILIERISRKKINLSNSDDIIVDGNTGIKYNLAKCCKPVKGDSIVGFITKGEGVTVHTSTCPNVNNNSERIINVEWNMNTDNAYLTDIELISTSNNFLVDVMTEATKENITIMEVRNKELDNGISSTITVKVKGRDELDHFKNILSRYKEIKVSD